MSMYSANQYESAFKPQRLQNWCEPKQFKERPAAQEGHITFIADNRGHLLPGVKKRGKAWPDFKGTWDLPARIPTHHINPTGRSVEGLNRLKSWGFDLQHSGSKNTDRLQAGVGAHTTQTNGDEQQDGAALSVNPASREAPSSSKQRHKDEHQDQ
ncbi:protein Flattop-like [Anarrhichthys ocellatus]|uniref:protein Flattop-like n=1 Tax=Anarrhichthys ocellatus TaxID=433405 RepID=UPI0012EDC396|nr:protein Flattop-like [Anarrhichthys ocellatus]XP_031694271.1 protein Flattop-like [Anarrhichthys ocellatus]